MIVFRTDASISLGYGHVMRCLALADAFNILGEKSIFIFSKNGDALCQEVSNSGHKYIILENVFSSYSRDEEVADAKMTLSSLPSDSKLLIVDHYHLHIGWEEIVNQSGLPLLVIDDLLRNHNSNFLLNQSLITNKNPYFGKIPSDCTCFFGPNFSLLSPPFKTLRSKVVFRKKLKRVLIFFGGSDQDNETEKALTGILSVDKPLHIDVDVVIGRSNPHQSRLARICNTSNITLHIQTTHMANLMLSADLAVGAGGSASWERCCLGLPALVSIQADNQAPIATKLHQLGALYNLGMTKNITAKDYSLAFQSIDDDTITKMSRAAYLITDGNGANRVASSILSMIEHIK